MRSLVLLAAAAALAGCPSSTGPKQVGAQPSWRGSGTKPPPVVAPVTYTPTTEPVLRYNEPFHAPAPTPLGDAVVAAVRDAALKAGTPVPLADARLFRACEELAQIVPEEDLLSYTLIEFALQRNGIIEPYPRVLTMWGSSSPEAVLKELQPLLADLLTQGANTRVGIGVAKRKSDGTSAIVFALQGSSVATAPIPRALPAKGSFKLDAVIDARFKEPELFVTYNSGETERIDFTPGHAGGLTANVACGARTGRQQVEITAADQNGATVLANFPIWCAEQPPSSVTLEPTNNDAPVTTTEDAERRLLALVNQDRAAAGMPPLAWDEKLAAVARGHSEEMRRTKNVAHISPTTGSAADRVRAAKIKTAVVLENVARAYGVGEAHQGLMNSPGHRANVMSRAATQIGIGVVFGDEFSKRREIFVTQVFTRVPPKIDPAQAAATVAQRLSQGVGKPLGNAVRLASIAQQYAEALAAGRTSEQAYPLVKKQLEALGASYARVGTVITAAADLDTLDGKSLLGGSSVDDIGVGIAQGPHPEIGEGAMWIVVLLGQKR